MMFLLASSLHLAIDEEVVLQVKMCEEGVVLEVNDPSQLVVG